MIHHPIVLGAKLIVLMVILVVLLILYSVLPPEQFRVALWIAAGAFVAAVAGLWVFAFKVLANPDSKIGKRLTLPERTNADDDSAASASRFSAMLGARGVAASALRPAGIAIFAGERVSVVTDGEFIEKGSAIAVVSTKGSRVVVRIADE